MPNKLVLADAKKGDVLEGGRPYLNTLVMRLYVTAMALSGAVQPDVGLDEPDDGGYAPAANPFPSPAATVGTVGRADSDPKTFGFDHDSGDQTIVGVFFTDPADGNSTVMAQKMEADFTITVAGQVIVVSGPFDLDTLD